MRCVFDDVTRASGSRTEAGGTAPPGWPGLCGKRVPVTGGTQGLGEQVVRLPAAQGTQVATCARTAGAMRGRRRLRWKVSR